MGRIYSEEERADMAQYTLHGRYNNSTEKPYVEIKKNGEHYAYAPWSLFRNQIGSVSEGDING